MDVSLLIYRTTRSSVCLEQNTTDKFMQMESFPLPLSLAYNKSL